MLVVMLTQTSAARGMGAERYNQEQYHIRRRRRQSSSSFCNPCMWTNRRPDQTIAWDRVRSWHCDHSYCKLTSSTAVGERGISLSGGQKSRVCLARAAYSNAPVVLLDDPLSAVDASVGHALLHNCILRGPLATRTRVLVTHHLDVLPEADLILVMDSDGSVGRIAQQGSYEVSRQPQDRSPIQLIYSL